LYRCEDELPEDFHVGFAEVEEVESIPPLLCAGLGRIDAHDDGIGVYEMVRFPSCGREVETAADLRLQRQIEIAAEIASARAQIEALAATPLSAVERVLDIHAEPDRDAGIETRFTFRGHFTSALRAPRTLDDVEPLGRIIGLREERQQQREGWDMS
jgi:hypothetical protein